MGPYEIGRLPRYVSEVNAILGGALASRPSLDEPHVTSRHLSPAYVETWGSSPPIVAAEEAGVVG